MIRLLLLILCAAAFSAAETPLYEDATPQYDYVTPQYEDATPEYDDADIPKEPASEFRIEDLPTDYPIEESNPLHTDEGLELVEGDMVLTEEQRDDRKASSNLWPGGVVRYAITSTSEGDRAAILRALEHWTSLTCVTFTEVPISFSGQPHLRFVKSSGCWSYVGRITWSQGQSVSIGNGCASLGVIAHEIGHALGFYHEQSRPDRDRYIFVLPQNMPARVRGNFAIAPNARNYSVPYDLTSVMHYSGFGFSNNGMPTIVVRHLPLAGKIGNRAGLSHRDAQQANLMYQCAASCASPPRCQNGGFVDKTCRCKCRPGTSGTLCETVTASYYGRTCGNQRITSPGRITSRNYPSLYPPGEHCVWIVRAPAGRRIRVRFDTARVMYRSGTRCYYDWITLHTNGDSKPEVVACGSELQGKTFTTARNRLAIEMHTYSRHIPSHQTGFSATVTFV